jgi:hypothetical protein
VYIAFYYADVGADTIEDRRLFFAAKNVDLAALSAVAASHSSCQNLNKRFPDNNNYQARHDDDGCSELRSKASDSRPRPSRRRSRARVFDAGTINVCAPVTTYLLLGAARASATAGTNAAGWLGVFPS